MARMKSGGRTGSEFNRTRALRGRLYARDNNGTLVVSTWPKKRGKPKSAVTNDQNSEFKKLLASLKYADPNEVNAARALAEGTAYTWRDILIMSACGTYIEIEGLEAMSIQQLLDMISDTPGAMLYRNNVTWVGLAPSPTDAVLAFDTTTRTPFWTDPSNTAITELTGDVTAGPGVGSQAATLSPTGVIAGTYSRPLMSVTGDGRITDIISQGDADTGITQLTGDITAGPGNGSQAATLANTSVAAGAYHHATVTFDAKGRATSAANGAAATSSAIGLVRPDGTSLTVDGSGVMSAIGGGGGGGALTLLATVSASASADLHFTGLSGGTTVYRLVGQLLVPATNAAELFMVLGTGTGPTYSTTNYYWGIQFIGSSNFTATGAGNNTTAFKLAPGSASGGHGASFDLTITGCRFSGTGTWASSDGNQYTLYLGGEWRGGTTFTAIKMNWGSGAIASGQVSLYALST